MGNAETSLGYSWCQIVRKSSKDGGHMIPDGWKLLARLHVDKIWDRRTNDNSGNNYGCAEGPGGTRSPHLHHDMKNKRLQQGGAFS